jgi:hypothetical protein
MGEPPLPAPWNRGPLTLLYLVLLGATTALLRLAGRGWISATIGGLILAGALFTLLVLVGSNRRWPWQRRE